MRSQKINNRTPRPFKTKTDRWSGGQSFIPVSGPKPAVRPAKPSAEETKDKAKGGQ